MRPWERALALIGVILILLGTHAIHRGTRDTAAHDFVLSEQGCNTPVTVLEKAGIERRGAAVAIHGFCANRKIMYPYSDSLARAGFRVYMLDLPGHGVNSDPFSFARAEKCTAVAIESLARENQLSPATTILAGHSMGGAIAVRMADHDPVAATLAISPGPMALPQRMPSNLLVFSAGHDLRFLKRQAEALAAAAEGNRTSTEDFTQRRAFELVSIPSATHTSLLLNKEVMSKSISWAIQAVQPPARAGQAADPSEVRIDSSVWGSNVGLLGIFLLFPGCATLAVKFAGAKRAELDDPRPWRPLAIIEGAVCPLFTVLALGLGTPLKFLHIYSGDYLVSLLLVVGLLYLALNWKDALGSLSFKIPRGLVTIGLGLATILAVGGWLNWHMTEGWLTFPRWLRFGGVLPFAWIYSYAEEVMLGPVRTGRWRAVRYLIFLVLRLELWAACAVAAYFLTTGQMIIVVLFVFLAAFSMLQRLAADALRLRTGSATAAAAFSAILASWFAASVFPLT